MAAEDEDRHDEPEEAHDEPTEAASDEDAPDSEESAASDDNAAAPEESPEEIEGPPRSHRMWMVAVVTIALLVFDLWTKQWAWDTLRDGTVKIVVDGWVYYEFGFNTGSAFSLLRDASWSRMLFIGITFFALIYMGYLARTLPTRYGSAFMAIAMVASGALGNLHDRFVRTMVIDGAERYGVVDFIKVYYMKGKPWPTFNIADVALVAGVLLLLVFLLRHGEVLDAEAKQRAEAKDAS